MDRTNSDRSDSSFCSADSTSSNHSTVLLRQLQPSETNRFLKPSQQPVQQRDTGHGERHSREHCRDSRSNRSQANTLDAPGSRNATPRSQQRHCTSRNGTPRSQQQHGAVAKQEETRTPNPPRERAKPVESRRHASSPAERQAIFAAPKVLDSDSSLDLEVDFVSPVRACFANDSAAYVAMLLRYQKFKDSKTPSFRKKSPPAILLPARAA
jgi:hypothetical protein